MYRDENKPASLAKLLNAYSYVFLDTCSLMEDGFAIFMDTLSAAKDYISKDTKIIVPKTCIVELKKHSKDKKNGDKIVDAKRALKIIKKAKWGRTISISKKDKSKAFADQVIFTYISELRIDYRTMVITQDKKLTDDLRSLNDLKSQYGNKVSIYRFNRNGELEFNRGEFKQFPKESNRFNSKPVSKPIPATKQPEAKPSEGNDLLAKIIASDKRIKANLSNANYPKNKLNLDIDSQLHDIYSLPSEKRSSLNLSVSIEKLREEKTKANVKDKPSKKVEETNVQDKQPAKEPAPAPKAEEKAPIKKEPEKKIWYGENPNIEMAITESASHSGVIFRDPSIAFIKMIHGEYDLTMNDLHAIAKLLQDKVVNGKSEITFKCVHARMEKRDRNYFVWVDFIATPIEEPKPIEPKPSKPKKAKKEAEAPVAKEKKKSEEAPKKSKKSKEKKTTITEEKPVEEPKKAPAKKSSKKKETTPEDKPALPEEKQAPTASKKAKKAKTKETSKEEAAPEKEAAAPKRKKSKAEGKKEDKPAKPVAKKKELSPLEKAKKAEKRLQSVLGNSNYAPEKKRKDISSQLKAVESLNDEERKALSLSKETLEEMLSQLN